MRNAHSQKRLSFQLQVGHCLEKCFIQKLLVHFLGVSKSNKEFLSSLHTSAVQGQKSCTLIQETLGNEQLLFGCGCYYFNKTTSFILLMMLLQTPVGK